MTLDFCRLSFLGFGFNSFLGRFGSLKILDSGFGFWFFGFPRIGLFINQLLIQSYIGTTVCTIADLPFFNSMVNTAAIVKHRIYVSKIFVEASRSFTIAINLYAIKNSKFT